MNKTQETTKFEINKIRKALEETFLKSNEKDMVTMADFLCGAGGVTNGAKATGKVKVIACLNHDKDALATHELNNEESVHFLADVTKMELEVMEMLIGLDVLWISPDCTHHSNAKGGQSRDADSRMLAEELFRYSDYLKPKFIFVENVREFMSWGELTEKRDSQGNIVYDKKTKKPIMVADKNKKGLLYRKWIKELKELGYTNYEYRLLNAADYGAPTSRVRYFGIFSRPGYKINFPKPTHDKFGRMGLKKWLPCKNYLDLNNTGESIFGRQLRGKKPLSEKTLKRIAYGIKKYVLEQFNDSFIAKYYGDCNNVADINEPLHTITTKDRHAMINVNFINQYYGRDDANYSINEPAKTITTLNSQSLVSVESNFISKGIWGASLNNSIDNPLNTILTEDESQLVTVEHFIEKHQFCEKQVSSIDNPLHTIVCGDRQALVSIERHQFLTKYFSGNHAASIDQPLPTITTVDHSALITVEKKQFIDKYLTGEYNVQSINEPLSTIVTVPKKSLLTVELLDQIIVDIKMRFLTPEELKLCQGFPKEYILKGPANKQKKFIGNSVPPQVVTALLEANYQEMTKDLEIIEYT